MPKYLRHCQPHRHQLQYWKKKRWCSPIPMRHILDRSIGMPNGRPWWKRRRIRHRWWIRRIVPDPIIIRVRRKLRRLYVYTLVYQSQLQQSYSTTNSETSGVQHLTDCLFFLILLVAKPYKAGRQRGDEKGHQVSVQCRIFHVVHDGLEYHQVRLESLDRLVGRTQFWCRLCHGHSTIRTAGQHRILFHLTGALAICALSFRRNYQ